MKLFKDIKRFLILFKDKNPVLLFFIISNFINGLLCRLFTLGNFKIRPLFFDFGFILILGAFSFLIKKRSKNVYYSIVSLVLILICIINSIYFNYYSSFVSVSLIATSVFIGDVGDAVMDFAVEIKDFIYLWQLIGLFICIKKSNKEEKVKKNFFIMLLISILFIGIGCALPPYNCWGGFLKLWNRVIAVDGFGIYTYQVDDFVQSLTPAFNNVFGYDEALQETKKYFLNNKKEKSDNEYTGIFEGKNVIAIHAESLQNFTLGLTFNDMEVTPNINKLVKNGIYFSNFYPQQGVGTSSDTEFTYSSSLLPANNGTVFVNYYNNKFITTQNLLNDKGYYVFSMHGNVGDFWNRDIMHLNMGYDKYYSKTSFNIDEEYGLGLSDESFFRQVVPMIKEIDKEIGEPYYGTLITLTNHTPWKDTELYSDFSVTKKVNVNGKTVERKYLEDTVIGKYIKAVNYMDKAIGNFINDMEKEGLLDNTVIIIYGDHDANIDKKYYDYMYNYDAYNDKVLEEGDNGYIDFNNYEYELNKKVPLIIWSKDMTNGKNVNIPMGMIDAAPTIGNMLNIYNPYALGNDVMNIDNGENIVIFKDGAFITNKIYYNASKNEVYTITNSVISDDYIEKNRKYANKIIEISNNIIAYDLLRDLE
ncbi:MAG: LTA synthase family protein [Bacilli bacterium]|nr:LTA synthase family protein [Bacilli bacterium]